MCCIYIIYIAQSPNINTVNGLCLSSQLYFSHWCMDADKRDLLSLGEYSSSCHIHLVSPSRSGLSRIIILTCVTGTPKKCLHKFGRGRWQWWRDSQHLSLPHSFTLSLLLWCPPMDMWGQPHKTLILKSLFKKSPWYPSKAPGSTRGRCSPAPPPLAHPFCPSGLYGFVGPEN